MVEAAPAGVTETPWSQERELPSLVTLVGDQAGE